LIYILAIEAYSEKPFLSEEMIHARKNLGASLPIIGVKGQSILFLAGHFYFAVFRAFPYANQQDSSLMILLNLFKKLSR